MTTDDTSIQPALTVEQWAWVQNPTRETPDHVPPFFRDLIDEFWQDYRSDNYAKAQAIAVLNSLLPDDDPRKITMHKVAMLHRMADIIEKTHHVAGLNPLRSIADQLAALLPPEP